MGLICVFAVNIQESNLQLTYTQLSSKYNRLKRIPSLLTPARPTGLPHILQASVGKRARSAGATHRRRAASGYFAYCKYWMHVCACHVIFPRVECGPASGNGSRRGCGGEGPWPPGPGLLPLTSPTPLHLALTVSLSRTASPTSCLLACLPACLGPWLLTYLLTGCRHQHHPSPSRLLLTT